MVAEKIDSADKNNEKIKKRRCIDMFYERTCNYSFPWSTTSRYTAFLYDKKEDKQNPDYPAFDRQVSFCNVDSCIVWLVHLIEHLGGKNAVWYEACIEGDNFEKQYHTYDEILEDLWKTLTDVNVNEDEETEWNWFIFPAGTNRDDIWHWFDERYSNGVYHLLYENDN